MTAKEYLDSIFLVKAYIDKKERKYENLKIKAQGIKTQTFDDVKVQSGGRKQDFTDYIDQYATIETEFVYDYFAFQMVINKMTNEIFAINNYEALLTTYKKNLEKGYRPSKAKSFEMGLAEFEEVHAKMLEENKSLLDFFHDERSKSYNNETI